MEFKKDLRVKINVVFAWNPFDLSVQLQICEIQRNLELIVKTENHAK